MKTINIDELKDIQVKILLHVDNFCKENNISYFLAGGTLLGAVRHHGFIPWDDDIDIMMKRDDYEKFIKLYPKNDVSPYKLYSPEIDRAFPYPYAKIDDSRTVFKEEINDSVQMGVNIDLFPIDKISDDATMQKSLVRRNKFWIDLLTLKRLPLKKRRGLIKNTTLLLSHILLYFLPYSYIVERIIKNAESMRDANTSHCGDLVWGYGIREIMPSNVFSKSLKMKFEDYEFPVPVGYDTFLHNLFGDYMQLPPVEQRVTHHNYEAYWK